MRGERAPWCGRGRSLGATAGHEHSASPDVNCIPVCMEILEIHVAVRERWGPGLCE